MKNIIEVNYRVNFTQKNEKDKIIDDAHILSYLECRYRLHNRIDLFARKLYN